MSKRTENSITETRANFNINDKKIKNLDQLSEEILDDIGVSGERVEVFRQLKQILDNDALLSVIAHLIILQQAKKIAI